MKEKETMILEYNPKEDSRHIYFLGEDKPPHNPDWLNFGMFHGTMLQASKELDRRIRKFKKENKKK